MSEAIGIGTTSQADEQSYPSKTPQARKVPFSEKVLALFINKVIGTGSKASGSSPGNMLAQFHKLSTLNAVTKESLKTQVASYQRQLIGRDHLIKAGQVVSSWALMILGIGWFIVSFRLPSIFHVNYSIGGPISASLMGILTFIAYSFCSFIFVAPSLLKVNSGKALFIWHFSVTFVYMVVFIPLVLFIPHHSSPNLVFFSIGSALLGNVFFEGCYYFFVIVLIVFGRIAVERWYTVRYPLATLVFNLIDVLHSVEHELQQKQKKGTDGGSQSFGVDLKAKQRQLSGLEVAARCVQWYLPRQLYGGDVDTDVWWKEVTQQVANALHDKKRWILTPKKDTYEWLSQKLASTLICFLNGDWDGLEKISIKAMAALHTGRSHMLHGLGLAIEAVIPFIVFLILQHFVTLSPLVRDYAIVGLLLWAMITIAGALDPKFSDKISAINDLTPFK